MLASRRGRRSLKTAGTGWTNQQMLFHMLFGHLSVSTLLRLVRPFGRLPDGFGVVFARALNSATLPFHVINYLASCGGGLVPRRPASHGYSTAPPSPRYTNASTLRAMTPRLAACTSPSDETRSSRQDDAGRGIPLRHRALDFHREQFDSKEGWRHTACCGQRPRVPTIPSTSSSCLCELSDSGSTLPV